MSPFYRRGDLSPPAVPVGVDGPTPVSGLRDARERFRAALGGISVELAALPWDWRERTDAERAADTRRPEFVGAALAADLLRLQVVRNLLILDPLGPHRA